VLVSGAAGIGKTTIVAALAGDAEAHGAQVAIGHCYDRSMTAPYEPWLELELFDTLRGGPGSSESPLGGQRELFEQVRTELAALAARRPLVLVLEDLHWSDAASLELLRHVARQLARVPVLLLGTYRDDEPGGDQPFATLWPLLIREAAAVRIDLRPWDDAAVRALVTDRCRLPVADAERLSDYLIARGQGHPLFTEELLRTLEQSGTLQPGAAGWQLGDLTHIQVPALVRHLIEGRLGRLDAETRSALEIAAIIGQAVPLDLWSQVSGLTDERLDHVVTQAVEAHLLVELPDASGWQFSHALVRDAFVERLSLPRRRQWHRRVAEALAMVTQPDVDAVADHFQQAADPRANDWQLRAGDRAQTLYAVQSAIEQFTRVLHTPQATAEQQLQARRARARAYETLGDFAGARTDFEVALTLARGAGDQHTECQLLLAYGLLWSSRDYSQAGTHVHRALALARELDDQGLLAHTLNRVGNWHLNMDEIPVALGHHEEALAIFGDLQDRHGLLETLDLLTITTLVSTDFPRMVAYAEQAIELARALDERVVLSTCLTFLMLAGATTEYDGAILLEREGVDWLAYGEEALAIARSAGWRAGEILALYFLGQCLASRGAFRRAFTRFEEALTLSEAIGHQLWLVQTHAQYGIVYEYLLDLPRARQHLEQAVTLASTTSNRFLRRGSSGVLASACILDGDLARAEEVLEAVLPDDTPIDSNTQRVCWLARAELALARDEPDTALAIAERLIAHTPHASPTRVPIGPTLVRARALAALDRPAEAEASLRAAQLTAAAFQRPPLLWRLHVALATLYTDLGRAADAERELQAARSLAETLAAEIPDETARDHFQRAAEACYPTRTARRTRGPASTAPFGLSERELEVLRLLVEGASDREIAAALFISVRTAQTHVTNILNKLGVASRTAAASVAIRHGIA
jgi:DNA-binding NarL/FixJ family response regulator